MFGLVGDDLDTGLFNNGLDLPLADWASLSARTDFVFPKLGLTKDKCPDFDGLDEAPSDFKLSSGDLGLFGEPVAVFIWLMFPETISFGLCGFLNCKASLGSCKPKKVKNLF